MGNILIIGAGISGCVAARQLAEHGDNVIIINKNHIVKKTPNISTEGLV